MWCTLCNKAVQLGSARAVSLAIAPLTGLAIAGLPRILGRRRLGRWGWLANGAFGLGAAYLANRFVAPRLSRVVCGDCGSRAVAAAS
jgi:hypothetical protein